MGTWSVSITGNDTAADLRSEYQAAFYHNDVDLALSKIDAYVRKNGFDESYEEEWCDYYYSLADFMWSKGILTDVVRSEALRLIDSGFGLAIWEEAGTKTLEARKKALQKFRDKITSPQPQKKKITINLYTKPIFNIGDVIALQLQTLNKPYFEPREDNNWHHSISEDDFRALDGKYIVIRKIADEVSYISQVEPAVCDIWPQFQLYSKVFDGVPDISDVINLSVVKFKDHRFPESFTCPGSMFYFRKRKYVVLGNSQHGLKDPEHSALIDFGNIYDEMCLINVLFPL